MERSKEKKERKEEKEGGRDGKDARTPAQQKPQTTTSKLKERWLLTRKTWRYMSDAGKRLFPEGVNPNKPEDVPKVEEHFQVVNKKAKEFIPWPITQASPKVRRRQRTRKKSVASDTSDVFEEFADTEEELLAASSGQQCTSGSVGAESCSSCNWRHSTSVHAHIHGQLAAQAQTYVHGQHVHGQHVHGQHVHGQHVHGQHVHGQHVHGQHIHGQHVHGQHVHGQHVHGHVHGQHVHGQHVHGQHVHPPAHVSHATQASHGPHGVQGIHGVHGAPGAQGPHGSHATHGHGHAHPHSVTHGSSSEVRERHLSMSDLPFEIPPELYQQLVRNYGFSTLHYVANRLLEEQLMEEDEYEDDEDGEVVEMDGKRYRNVGAQTEPYLDMCVQTDEDATAEDFVKVGAEPRHVTEAETAKAQALAAEEEAKTAAAGALPKKPKGRRSSLAIFRSDHHQQQQQQQQQEPPKEGNPGSTKGSAAEKDRGAPPPKGGVAAKLAWAEAAAASQKGAAPAPVFPGQRPKPQENKSKFKNVFKLGLKCDIEPGGSSKKSVEKTKVDRFKTVNYDKTLRNIKSKWVPGPDDDELMGLGKKDVKEVKEVKDGKKRKVKGIQVGDPLPQFILNAFRVSSPIEIIHAYKRRARRRISKADSSDFSSSECSASVPPSLPTSPRYSITVSDELGTRDLQVSEAEALRLSQMGSHITYKRSSIDASVDTSEFELGSGSLPAYGRSMSASQASGLLSQTGSLVHTARGSRASHPQILPVYNNPGSGHHRICQSLLQSLLPAVMQRTRSGGSGHASRLVAKKIWRARSKSQSRASAGSTSIWTPMGNSTWASVTGRIVQLEGTSLLHLSELERLTLQQIAIAKLQALNLGCQIRAPRGSSDKHDRLAVPSESGAETAARPESNGSNTPKKRRPYLLKKKALSTGLFESKKEEGKGEASTNSTGGLVFGLSLGKCIENERSRSREATERAAAAAAAAVAAASATPPSTAPWPSSVPTGEMDLVLSRKSSHGGSHASFSSLIEGTKQSTTGSLESLNLERKRPSLASGDMIHMGITPDVLTPETNPQGNLKQSTSGYRDGDGRTQTSSRFVRIPELVSICFRHLEHNGLHTLGIFRVSSSKKRVRQLREEFDSGREVNLTADHCPHDVATLLKEFFRDLPDPLLTRELYEALLRTQTVFLFAEIRNRKLQFEALQHLVQLLPAPNRDTLHALLTFLASVAEHAQDVLTKQGETVQGNKMDSSNLATLFAPNILHDVRPGTEQSTSELVQHAEERIDVINVVRSMIDHNKELFELSAEMLDEVYHHLMDTRPDALDLLLRRRSTGMDELDLEIDTSSSVFEGSECSSSLPRSPTEHHDLSHHHEIGLHHDLDRQRISVVPSGGEEVEAARTRRRREEVLHEGAAVVTVQQTGRRRREVEDQRSRGRRREKSTSRSDGPPPEERSWFRKREKSSSREQDRTSEERVQEKSSRWFRKRDKSSSRGSSDDKIMSREGSDKREKSKCRDDSSATSLSRRRSLESQARSRPIPIEKSESLARMRLACPDPEIDVDVGSRSSSEHTVTHECLRVPEPTVRRLSSPEIDNTGVITASLRIPVPLHQSQVPLSFAQDTDIPYIEDPSLQSSTHTLTEPPRKEVTRQRSGSNDSYLGQPITGTMSFQPLNKKSSDKQSHDSVLSSSSAEVFTLSPSLRNTPSSDHLYASGTSSPLSGTGSPALWLSPDSGTPGLTPPNSPPPNSKRRGEEYRHGRHALQSLAHSTTHTFGSKPPTTPAKDKAAMIASTPPSKGFGVFPIGRSKTADSIKVEKYILDLPTGQTSTFIKASTSSGHREEGSGGSSGSRSKEDGSSGGREVRRRDSSKKYSRRRYTGERHQTGQLPELAGTSGGGETSTEGQTQLWKRWEIIASDPTEPETFV
ncbi:uncharacterized protein LOC143036847 isoform X2 [Oratosquilla oratoria]|uniref:uncharacterized protein LOC143036847 isoform X2 n=1 Tax=Oratosquilla oratoria TaxID=337810 RepID=UPI003F769BCB